MPADIRSRALSHGQPPESTTLPHDTGLSQLAQTRLCGAGNPPLFAREVVDEIRAGRVVLSHIVVVDRLLEEDTSGNKCVNCSGGGGGLPEERLAVDLAHQSTVDLDSRVWPDHLQVEDIATRPHCIDHIAQDVHDVLRLYSSE